MNILSRIPRIHLAQVPTPLQEAPRLAQHAGLDRLYIKRDDLTGFAGGGTKVRKLEYDFAEIVAKGYDVIVTAGGVQSNLVRLSAAVAARYGIALKAVLGGPEFTSHDGNLLLDGLFGAEIRFLPNDDDNDRMTGIALQWMEELRSSGAHPYLLPIGGSTPLGSLGCISVMSELADALGRETPLQVIVPVGSCGTYAGLLVGARMVMPNARIIGISISRSGEAIRKRSAELIAGCAELLQTKFDVPESSMECYDTYFGEYGTPTAAGQQAVIDSARLEGLLLDPVYTGKAMAGLIDLAAKKELQSDIPAVFLHTGGLPVLFSYEQAFRSFTRINTVKGTP
jgi:D-cysteine desulfhydrase